MPLKDAFISPVHDKWTSNGTKYDVGVILRHLRSEGAQPRPLPLSLLKPGFDKTNTDEPKWSVRFVERMERASDDPILVVVSENGKHWIADGNHRFARKLLEGALSISCYVVAERDLPASAIVPA